MAESETLQPPRYRGSLERIEGEIDEDEALALAMECRPIELERDQVSKTPTPWLSIILLPLLVIGIIGLLVYPGNNASPTKDGASGSGPGNGASLSYESSLLWFLLVVIVVGMVLVLLIRKSKVRFADSDPPLGGHTLVKLTALGCSIVKTTRDDRLIEVFCSWRQTQVTSSENAWLLNIGLANPFLLAKKWVDNQSERSKLDELCREIANWNAHQPTPLSLDSVPEEASESFPDFQRDATKMVVSSVVERRARKQVAKQIRARLPEYRPLHTRWTRWMIWWTVLLASLVGLMLLPKAMKSIGSPPSEDWASCRGTSPCKLCWRPRNRHAPRFVPPRCSRWAVRKAMRRCAPSCRVCPILTRAFALQQRQRWAP